MGRSSGCAGGTWPLQCAQTLAEHQREPAQLIGMLLPSPKTHGCLHSCGLSLNWESFPSAWVGLLFFRFFFFPCVWCGVDTGAQPLILDKTGAFCIMLSNVTLLELFEPYFFLTL